MLFFSWLLAYGLSNAEEAELRRPSPLNDSQLPSTKPQLAKFSHRHEFTLVEEKPCAECLS